MKGGHRARDHHCGNVSRAEYSNCCTLPSSGCIRGEAAHRLKSTDIILEQGLWAEWCWAIPPPLPPPSQRPHTHSPAPPYWCVQDMNPLCTANCCPNSVVVGKTQSFYSYLCSILLNPNLMPQSHDRPCEQQCSVLKDYSFC